VLVFGVGASVYLLTRGGSSRTRPDPAPAVTPIVRKTAPSLPKPASKPAPPARFTFVGSGDIALRGAADPAVVAGLRRFLKGADVAIGNLEGTLAVDGAPKCDQATDSGCFTFRASPAWAAVLRQAGFTDLNLANNHALDYGPIAQAETLAALTGARLLHDGLPHEITYLTANKVKVAVIGVAPYHWAQELLDIPGGQALVRRAAKRADIVIVYMHAGAEGGGADHVTGREETFLGEDRGNPEAFAHAMVNAGADLVFASGPHVVRGMQWYHGRLIAYSLGNLVSVGTLSISGSGGAAALLKVILDSTGRFIAGSVIPLRLVGDGTPVYDAEHTSVALIRTLSREDFPGSGVRLSPTGKIAPRRTG
jgi:hypothetical protein